MEAILGALVTAVVGGVLAFAREQIKNSREDSAFYRDRLLPSIENNTVSVKELREAVTLLKPSAKVGASSAGGAPDASSD